MGKGLGCIWKSAPDVIESQGSYVRSADDHHQVHPLKTETKRPVNCTLTPQCPMHFPPIEKISRNFQFAPQSVDYMYAYCQSWR